MVGAHNSPGCRVELHRHPHKEELHERPDRERVQHGANTDDTAEQPATDQHHQLDAGAQAWEQLDGAPDRAAQKSPTFVN